MTGRIVHEKAICANCGQPIQRSRVVNAPPTWHHYHSEWSEWTHTVSDGDDERRCVLWAEPKSSET